MALSNGEESTSNSTPNETSEDSFVFFSLKEETLEKYGLPKQPCPVRMSMLDNVLSRGELEFQVLADECILYDIQHPGTEPDIKPLLLRLCYLAGVMAGHGGDDLTAQEYLAKAYDIDPCAPHVAPNYALALSRNGQRDEAIIIFEKVISSFDEGKGAFSAQIWAETVKLHCRQGNFKRALELVEVINEKNLATLDDPEAIIQSLRSRIENDTH